MKNVVYKIVNTANSKVYVGQTVKELNRRISQHLSALRRRHHVNRRLQDDWNHYGESVFVFEVVGYADKTQLDDLERDAIHAHSATNPDFGYNTESGGRKGKTFSSPLKGVPMTDVHKAALRNSKAGKSYSDVAYRNAPKVSCVCENVITQESKVFPTLAACADEIGVGRSIVVNHVRRNSNLISKTWRVRRAVGGSY